MRGGAETYQQGARQNEDLRGGEGPVHAVGAAEGAEQVIRALDADPSVGDAGRTADVAVATRPGGGRGGSRGTLTRFVNVATTEGDRRLGEVVQLAGVGVEGLADHDAGLGDAVVVARRAGQAFQACPDIEVTGDGPEGHVALIARRPDVGTAGDDVNLVRVATETVPWAGSSPHIERREALQAAHRRAVANIGNRRAIRDAERIDRERRGDWGIQKQTVSPAVGADFHPSHVHQTAVDDVGEEVATIVGIDQLIETDTDAESIDAAHSREEGRRDVISYMKGRHEVRVGARCREEHAVLGQLIHQGDIEGIRGLAGSRYVGEAACAIRLALPLIRGGQGYCGRNGRIHRQRHEVVFRDEQVGRRTGHGSDQGWVAGDAAEEGLGGVFVDRVVDRHRADDRASSVRGPEGHLEVVTAAAFLHQPFHVVSLALVQRYRRAHGLRVVDVNVGRRRMDEHGATGRVLAVRIVDVHPKLASVVTADVEAVEARVGRHEIAADARAVVLQQGVGVEQARTEHVRVVNHVRQVGLELGGACQVGHGAALDVCEQFHQDAVSADLPGREVDHGIGGDRIRGGAILRAIDGHRVDGIRRLGCGAHGEHGAALIQRRAEEPQAIVHLVVAQIAGGEGIHRLAELDGEPVGVTPAHGAGHGRCHTVGQHVHHDRAGHAAEEVGHLHGEDRAVVRQGERHGVVGEGVFQDAHAVLGPDEAAVGQRAADAGGQQRQRLTGGDGGGQAIHRLRRRGGDVGKADCACAANFHRILQQVVLDDLGQRRNRRVALRADGKADAVAAAAFTVEDLGVILLATDERDVLAHQLAGGAEKGVGRLADQLLAGRIDGVHGIGVHPQLTDVVHGAVEAILTIAGRDEVGVGLAQIVVEARVAQRGLHAEVLLIGHGGRQPGDVVEVHRLKLVVVGREVGGRIQAGQLVEAGDEVIVAGVEFGDHRRPGRDRIRIRQIGRRDEDGVGRGGIGCGIRPHHRPAVTAGTFLVEDFHVVPLVGHQGVVGREFCQGSNGVNLVRGGIRCDQDFAQGIGARRVEEQSGMIVVSDPELVVAVGRRHEVGVALGAVIVLAVAERRDHVETK